MQVMLAAHTLKFIFSSKAIGSNSSSLVNEESRNVRIRARNGELATVKSLSSKARPHSKRIVNSSAVSKHSRVPVLPGSRFTPRVSTKRFNKSSPLLRKARKTSDEQAIHFSQHGRSVRNNTRRAPKALLPSLGEDDSLVSNTECSPKIRSSGAKKRVRARIYELCAVTPNYHRIASWPSDGQPDEQPVSNVYSVLYCSDSDSDFEVIEKPVMEPVVKRWKKGVRGGGNCAFSENPRQVEYDAVASGDAGRTRFALGVCLNLTCIHVEGSVLRTTCTPNMGFRCVTNPRTEFINHAEFTNALEPLGENELYEHALDVRMEYLLCNVASVDPWNTNVYGRRARSSGCEISIHGARYFLAHMITPWGLYAVIASNNGEARLALKRFAIEELISRYYDPTLHVRWSVRGGGGGNRMITNGILNKGTGGASKVPKAPKADPAVAIKAIGVAKKDNAANKVDAAKKKQDASKPVSSPAPSSGAVGGVPSASTSKPPAPSASPGSSGSGSSGAPSSYAGAVAGDGGQAPAQAPVEDDQVPLLLGLKREIEIQGAMDELDGLVGRLGIQSAGEAFDNIINGGPFNPDDDDQMGGFDEVGDRRAKGSKENAFIARFAHVACPNVKKHWKRGEVRDNAMVVDMNANPFCGIHHCSVAMGLDADPKLYYEHIPLVHRLNYAAGRYTYAQMRTVIVNTIGDSQWLSQFCGQHGFGLRVSIYGDANVHVIDETYNLHLDKCVWLKFAGPADNGHYTLYVHRQSNVEHYNIEDLPQAEVKINWKLLGLTAVACLALHPVGALIGVFAPKISAILMAGVHIEATVLVGSAVTQIVDEPEIGEVFYEKNNDDRRSIQNKRDTMKYQESYRRVTIHKKLGMFGQRLDIPDIIDDWTKKEYVVSQTLFNHIVSDMTVLYSTGAPDPNVAIKNINRYRELNVNVNRPEVLVDTAELCKWYSSMLPKRTSYPVRNLRGLVALAAPGEASHIPNVRVVQLNQASSIVAGGGKVPQGKLLCKNVEEFVDQSTLLPGVEYGADGKICPKALKHSFNHVVKYRLERGKEADPVAVAPLGPLLTNGEIVGPGLMSRTDSPSVLASFLGRMMTKERNIDEELDRFVEFSKQWLEPFIEGVDVSNLCELDGHTAFREAYQHKKGAGFVKRHLDMRDAYETANMTIKELDDYLSHGCFVKFESNIKRPDGEVEPRPRMIMTMSDQMLYECVQALILIHAWNAGPFSKFQIKDMEPAQMIEKIMSVSDRPHMVTDYSSFEASIDDRIRTLEVHVMTRLCERAGFFNTKRAVIAHCTRYRILKCKWGSFSLTTRCSGDFWTSFGNGVVNVCINAYCAFKAGINEFELVAEGDDGLIPAEIANPELVNKVGIKFSCELDGVQPGDCDFLKSRWMDGRRYLNVGATLAKSLWVKDGCKLKRSKQLFILRCIGNSLYHLSPGHPVLTALVNRIGKETAGMTPFKNYTNYLDRWKNLDHTEHMIRHVEVDESMRMELARGAHGFPPIPISDQISLEERIEAGDFDIGDLLDEYSEIWDFRDSWHSSRKLSLKTDQFKAAVECINVCSRKPVIVVSEEVERCFSEGVVVDESPQSYGLD